MTIQTINQKPEVTLYFAEVATDKISEYGNIIYEWAYFETVEEAESSGFEYRIATWEDINDLADGGHTFPDVIINTPQGKFELVEIIEEDYYNDGEQVVTDVLYRHHNAPETFSIGVEYHLFNNKHSKLIGITVVNEVYTAQVKNLDDETLYTITDEMKQANTITIIDNDHNVPDITIGKSYHCELDHNGENFILNDAGKEQYCIDLLSNLTMYI